MGCIYGTLNKLHVLWFCMYWPIGGPSSILSTSCKSLENRRCNTSAQATFYLQGLGNDRKIVCYIEKSITRCKMDRVRTRRQRRQHYPESVGTSRGINSGRICHAREEAAVDVI